MTGPTGVGKTDFVLSLAAQFPAEIINADIGQMYAPLSIGTAKPDWQNEPVPHHLFDILDAPKDFSYVQFRALVLKLVPEIWARGKTPIIVGGSTMYIKALFYAPSNAVKSQISSFKRKVVDSSNENLWQELNLIDPERAQALHKNDTYRIQRALEIWQDSGVLPSQCQPQYDPIFKNMQLFVINAPKTILYARINARVHQMMEMGWLEEVAVLAPDWRQFLRHKKIIGYELLVDYLEQNKISLVECILMIQKRVRNYAKRQQTFLQGLQKNLRMQADMQKAVFELDLTKSQDIGLYLEQVLKQLKQN